MLVIGVIGASYENEELNRIAYEVGHLIAEGGAALLCGGLGGVMLHACRGAKDANGLTIGIIPTDRKEDANPYVDVPVLTGMGYARNVIIANTSDAIIAVGGKYGTLSEIGHALNMGKQVFSLKSWEGLAHEENFVVVKNPEEAVGLAFRYANR